MLTDNNSCATYMLMSISLYDQRLWRKTCFIVLLFSACQWWLVREAVSRSLLTCTALHHQHHRQHSNWINEQCNSILQWLNNNMQHMTCRRNSDRGWNFALTSVGPAAEAKIHLSARPFVQMPQASRWMNAVPAKDRITMFENVVSDKMSMGCISTFGGAGQMHWCAGKISTKLPTQTIICKRPLMQIFCNSSTG